MKKLMRRGESMTIQARSLMATDGSGPGTKSQLHCDAPQDPLGQQTSHKTYHYGGIPERERYEWLKKD